MLDVCFTPPNLTGQYNSPTQHEKSENAKKAWIDRMDKNIKVFDEVVSEMNEMVKVAKEKYFWNVEIMKKCSEWDERVPKVEEEKESTETKEGEDEDAIVTPLTEQDVENKEGAEHNVDKEPPITTDDDADVAKNITTEPVNKEGGEIIVGVEHNVDKESPITNLELQKLMKSSRVCHLYNQKKK